MSVVAQARNFGEAWFLRPRPSGQNPHHVIVLPVPAWHPGLVARVRYLYLHASA